MLREAGSVLFETFRRWVRDRCHGLGAALSFYALLCIPSFVVLTISGFNWIFGSQKLHDVVIPFLQHRIEPRMLELVRFLIFEVDDLTWKDVSKSFVGLVALALGLAGFAIQLKESLETLRNKRTTEPGIRELVVDHLWTIGLAIIFSITAMLSISIRIFAHNRASDILSTLSPTFLYIVDLFLGGFFLGGLCVLLYKMIPKVQIPWTDALRGGILTGLLFIVGRELSSFYLARQHVADLKGVSADIVLFLLWTYFYSQVFFVGAEFTHVLADRRAAKLAGREYHRAA
jgi:membrane protein